MDYKAAKKTTAKISIALAMIAGLWVGIRKWDQVNDKKYFDILPKSQQELVIKLRQKKLPEKTILVNIQSYDDIIALTKRYETILEQEDIIHSRKTPVREKDISIQKLHLTQLNFMLMDGKRIQENLSLVDQSVINDLMSLMEATKTQIANDIKLSK